MAKIVVALGLVAALCATAWAAETYKSNFENVDVDKILASKRLVDNYVLCLTDNNKPCPPDGADLKRLLPEIIKTNCAKCTDGQTKKGAEILEKLRDNYPDAYKKLSDKWDPTDAAFKKFSEKAKSKH